MSAVRLDGRVAIVTGGGRGLGRAYAVALADAGARVVVNDLDAAGAQETVDTIAAAGGEAVAHVAAVGPTAVADALVARALDAFGRLDVMCTNAGVLRDRVLWKMSDEDFDLVIETHLRGTFTCARAAAIHLREQGEGGRIIVVGSPAGQRGNFGQTNYAAAKMGLVGLSNTIAVEGARNGILSNVIMPVAKTRMTEELLGDFANVLAPELVTPMVAYLCSEACTTTHGAYSAAGGRYARVFWGLGQGWFAGKDAQPTAEDIAEHFGDIDGQDGYIVPGSTTDEIMALAGLFQ
jgi:NAD(P)-dependent dehydrogenase (short-subunit alcohol dehydrogenase family)